MANFRVKGVLQLTVTINEFVENVVDGAQAKSVVLDELINYPNVEVTEEKLLITKVTNDAR